MTYLHIWCEKACIGYDNGRGYRLFPGGDTLQIFDGQFMGVEIAVINVEGLSKEKNSCTTYSTKQGILCRTVNNGFGLLLRLITV